MKINNRMEELFEEFGSSMSANVIVHGPGDISDLRNELLKGCVQCEKRIGEFMLPQDIACALTAGIYEIKPEAKRLLSGIWNNRIPISKARTNLDGLVRASGDTAKVLKNLKEADPIKFLQVLCILWKYEKEKESGRNNSL
ncbi:MAG: hypothetical protein DRG25_02990 [Deltaproteobacteria bacterium]|nr:MAG: hypothetical protein DRG25_02990 [Deltaproteobacteria bacterium]